MDKNPLPRFFAAAAIGAVAVMIAACGATVSDPPGGVEVVSKTFEASCLPLTCSGGNYACGSASDGCGGTLHCGTCPSGQVCNSNYCYPANCQPLTCAQVGANCNETGDGCGGIINCGTCPAGQICNSIFCIPGPPPCVPNTKTCEQRGDACGIISDGCGGPSSSCGTCGTGQRCCKGNCRHGSYCPHY